MPNKPNDGNNSNSSKPIPNSTPRTPRTTTRDGSGNNDTSRLDELFRRH